MKLASIALALAACRFAPAAPVAHHTSAPPKLGPSITREVLAQLRPVDAARVEDGPQALPIRGTKWVTVDANVISALACRPNGSIPLLVTDSRYVYVMYTESEITMPPVTDGDRPMMLPPTYCSYQRFVIPDGLAYGGDLKVK